MGWIALAIVFVGLLFKFPKWTMIVIAALIGIVVVGLIGLWIYSSVSSKRDRLGVKDVLVFTSIDLDKCSAKYPLRVHIKNLSNRDLEHIKIQIDVARVGFSFEPNYHYENRIESRRIVPAQSDWSWCFSTPNVANALATLPADNWKTRGSFNSYDLTFSE